MAPGHGAGFGTIPRDQVFAVDVEDNVWIGFANRGLGQVRRKPMRNFGVNDGLLSPVVRTVCPDLAGHLWICTTAGISVLADGKIEPLPPSLQQKFPWNTARPKGRTKSGWEPIPAGCFGIVAPAYGTSIALITNRGESRLDLLAGRLAPARLVRERARFVLF